MPLLILAVAWSAVIYPNDFWWHVRVGQLIAESRAIPAVDTFSFRHAGEPWTNAAWLMQLALYALLRAGGPPLVLFTFGLAVFAGYYALWRAICIITRGDLRVAAVLTIWAAATGAENWAVRPQGISFLFFGLTVYIITRYRLRAGGCPAEGRPAGESPAGGCPAEGRRAPSILWALPPLFALWVNAHGGFVFGLLLVACLAAAELWDTLRVATSGVLTASDVLVASVRAANVPVPSDVPVANVPIASGVRAANVPIASDVPVPSGVRAAIRVRAAASDVLIAIRAAPWRSVLLPALACLAALSLNPAGPVGAVDYVLGFLRSQGTMALNREFRPLTLDSVTAAAFYLGVVALFILFTVRRRRPDTFESLALLAFGFLALWAVRNPPWFGYIAAITLARAWSPAPSGGVRTASDVPVANVPIANVPTAGDGPAPSGGVRTASDVPVASDVLIASRVPAASVLTAHGLTEGNVLVLAIIGAALLLSLPWLRPHLPDNLRRRDVVHPYTPVEATARLCSAPSAPDPAAIRLFNDHSYGSYIIWACPRVPVFIDTRFELYTYDEWMEYIAISNARYDWQSLLDRHAITHLLLHPIAQAHLLQAARLSPCWREDYVQHAAPRAATPGAATPGAAAPGAPGAAEIAVLLIRDPAACPLPATP
jgi:hypothetical protein